LNLLNQAKSNKLYLQTTILITLHFNQESKNNLSMDGLVQNQLTKIIRLLIIVCLSLSPIANGAMLSASPDGHASIDAEHQCDHTVNHEAQNSAPSIFVTALNNSCEHSPSCNLLCSIAIELSVDYVSTLTQKKTINWSAMGDLNFKPSFLSRLDKPPRA
jgi:hypothetical protein